MTNMKKKAIVLLSGGLDSTVSLARGLNRYDVLLAINFDYGQRAAKMENNSAKKIAHYYGIQYRNIKLSWLQDITKTALVNRAKSVPEVDISQLDNKSIITKNAEAVWVPNRNAVFINIAAAFAESLCYNFIITGFDLEEAGTFPDNSIQFIKTINKTLLFSTLNGVKVISPVCNINKTQIVRLGQKLSVPLEFTWSCYKGGRKPCKRCESCQRVIRAFREVNSDGKRYR